MGVALKVFTKDKPLFSRLKNMERDVLLGMNVEVIPFASRALGGMAKAGIVSIGDLLGKSRFDLLKIPGVGRKAADQIEFYLSELGLHLAPTPLGWVVQPFGEEKRKTARELELETALREAKATIKRLTEVLG